MPAIVVSPFVGRGAAYGSKQDDDPDFLFDHTTLIKTILLRFADGDFSGLPARVASAAHLGHLLTEPAPREAPPVPAGRGRQGQRAGGRRRSVYG